MLRPETRATFEIEIHFFDWTQAITGFLRIGSREIGVTPEFQKRTPGHFEQDNDFSFLFQN
jgi:hypothetical protein